MSDFAPSAYFSIRNTLLKQSHQLAGVPEHDRGAVLTAALDAVPVAERLLRPYATLFGDGDSSASRLAFSCLSAAATFPGARCEQIADLGTLTAILFGVDDIADNVAGTWSPDDVVALFARLTSVLSGASPGTDAAGPMGEALHAWQSWCVRLRAYPGAATYAPVLGEQLKAAGSAMARERVWATGGEPWPDYERYLPNGAQTILYHAWWLAALAICGPDPADAGHWRAIGPATDLGAACLRLANDIRTFEREKGEGKPNSVLILERGGLDARAAVERVSAHIAGLNADFLAALAELPPALAGVADGQRRSVAFNGGWYLARDTHAYTVRELAEDAGTPAG